MPGPAEAGRYLSASPAEAGRYRYAGPAEAGRYLCAGHRLKRALPLCRVRLKPDATSVPDR